MIELTLTTSFKSKIEITAREMELQSVDEMLIKGKSGLFLVKVDSVAANKPERSTITIITVDGKEYLVCRG